jgi:putative two-component system response regulator
MDENKTVMVVDDTETNIDILVELLGDEYEIMVAMDGKECLEAVQMQTPDIFLLDVMMPGMDGYELCRKLKSYKRTKDVPVVFVTAKDAIDDKLDGYDAGGVDYITKPIDPEFTLATIKKHLKSE